MKRDRFRRPSTYTWALGIAMFLTVLWPATLQVRGMEGLVTEQPGIVNSITSSQVYNAEDGAYNTIHTYTFKDATTGRTFTPSPSAFGDSYGLIEGSAVRLGIVGDTLVSVDGKAIDQLDFSGRFLFGMSCTLIVLASSMTAVDHRSKKRPKLTPVTALVVSLILAIPTAIGGIATVALSTIAEHTLHFAYWPLAELALALGTSWLIYSRATKRPRAEQEATA